MLQFRNKSWSVLSNESLKRLFGGLSVHIITCTCLWHEECQDNYCIRTRIDFNHHRGISPVSIARKVWWRTPPRDSMWPPLPTFHQWYGPLTASAARKGPQAEAAFLNHFVELTNASDSVTKCGLFKLLIGCPLHGIIASYYYDTAARIQYDGSQSSFPTKVPPRVVFLPQLFLGTTSLGFRVVELVLIRSKDLNNEINLWFVNTSVCSNLVSRFRN